MPRIEIDPFQPGDEVARGAERGKVIQLRNRQTRETFLMVQVTEGPKKGTREYPRFGWTPLIHWSPDGPVERCVDCERLFHRTNFGSKELWCRTCARAQRPDYEADATPSHGYGMRARRGRGF